MGKRGPRPKPTNLKLIQGTYRRDRGSANEPIPEPVAPKCPTFLKAEARREWKRISSELETLGLLTQIDRAALAAYCSSWETFVNADKVIREKGLTLLTPNNFEQQRPEIAIRNKALQQMKSFLAEFGMTPAARTKISVPEAPIEVNNPFAELDKASGGEA